jgi:hypothetical protein
MHGGEFASEAAKWASGRKRLLLCKRRQCAWLELELMLLELHMATKSAIKLKGKATMRDTWT